MARRIRDLLLEHLLAIDDRHLPYVECQLVDVNEHPLARADLQGNVARGLRQCFEPRVVLGSGAACVDPEAAGATPGIGTDLCPYGGSDTSDGGDRLEQLDQAVIFYSTPMRRRWPAVSVRVMVGESEFRNDAARPWPRLLRCWLTGLPSPCSTSARMREPASSRSSRRLPASLHAPLGR